MDPVEKSTIIPSGNNFSVIRAFFLVLLFTVFLYRYVQNRSQRQVLPPMYQKPTIPADMHLLGRESVWPAAWLSTYEVEVPNQVAFGTRCSP